MNRRAFIAGLGGAAAWPLVAHEKLIEMFGFSGLSQYERLLEERNKGGKQNPEPAGPVIEGTATQVATEVEPPGDR